LSTTGTSSFLGGVYIFFPCILIAVINYFILKALIKNSPEIENDLKFQFLYKMSFFPYIFLGLAFFIQILGHRFIFSSLLFQFLVLLYVTHFNVALRPRFIIYCLFYSVFFFLYIYIIPSFQSENFLWSETIKIFNSNSFIKALQL
jgi:hypothetical protein